MKHKNWREKVSHILKENPFDMMEIIEEMHEDWGESVEEYFCQHITKPEQYGKYTKHFKNADGTSGPHWSVEDIKAKSGIDFDDKDYTCYDFAYAVNMRYSDDGDLMPIENIFKSGKRFLEDADSGCKDPSTRAYKDGKKRYLRFKNH